MVAAGGRAGVVDHEGRRGGRSERAHVLEVGRALPGRGRGRVVGSLLGAARGWPTAPTSARSRRSRRCGGCGSPGPEIAELLDRPLSTISGILTRIGMGKLGRLGLEPAQRYERARPGELIHIDVKKLGRIDRRRRASAIRGGGSHYTAPLHRSPPATSARPSAGTSCTSPSTTPPAWPTPRSSPDEKATTAVAFLRRALAFYNRHGITVERVMTDNGSRLPLHRPRHRLPHPRPPPPAHPALPPPDQRQSRTLHPHHARRLGLRRDLRHQPRTHRSP